MHKFTKALAAIGLAAVMSQSAMAETLKLGFLVKQPEEPWFQTVARRFLLHQKAFNFA